MNGQWCWAFVPSIAPSGLPVPALVGDSPLPPPPFMMPMIGKMPLTPADIEPLKPTPKPRPRPVETSSKFTKVCKPMKGSEGGTTSVPEPETIEVECDEELKPQVVPPREPTEKKEKKRIREEEEEEQDWSWGRRYRTRTWTSGYTHDEYDYNWGYHDTKGSNDSKDSNDTKDSNDMKDSNHTNDKQSSTSCGANPESSG